ncbi:MAG: hypothetical protein Q8Q14_08555 [Gemmatimonadales bacterium]|nr:hypothetical protein [Gemmatimonadales bacterium]
MLTTGLEPSLTYPELVKTDLGPPPGLTPSPSTAPFLQDSTKRTLNLVLMGGALLASWWLWEKLFWGPRRRRGIKAWQLWKQ